MSKEGCTGINSFEVSNAFRSEAPVPQTEASNWFNCFRRTNRRAGSVGKEGGADLQLPFLHPQAGDGESSKPWVEKPLEKKPIESPSRMDVECFK